MTTVGLIALVDAALFTGAAFYINFAEQPARLGLDDRALLAEWKPSYKQGFLMQATLAIVGFVLAALAWRQTQNWEWLVGGLVLLANWPFTLFVIMPTNSILMATPLDQASGQTRALIEKWGWLHSVRTGLGAVATIIFFGALLT